MDKKKTPMHQMKDSRVPPVKGAVTQTQDILQKPAAVFGPAHPMESMQTPALPVLEDLQ